MSKLLKSLGVMGAVLLLLVCAFLTIFMRFESSTVDSIQETTVRIQFDGEFSVLPSGAGEHSISWAAVNSLNYPELSNHLELIDFGASEPYTLGQDSLGNHYILLNFSKPHLGVNNYMIWMTVKQMKLETADIPQSFEQIPKEFMGASAKVQSDTPVFKNLAKQITQNSKTQLGKVTGVSKWVHEHFVYDASLEDQQKDALWALENKKGVCVEFAHATEALLRSLDIPARHVYGAAPEKYPAGWQEHTWVEAYIGRWVPVDPTWDETDSLDPAHITFARVPDQSFVEERVMVAGRGIEMGSMSLPKMTVQVLDEKRGKEPIKIVLFGKKITIG